MINQFCGFNIVILARNFNPMLFNQYWLITNGFLKEDENIQGSIFTDDNVEVNAEKFVLKITLQQLYFAPKLLDDLGPLVELVCNILSKVPETPFAAAGINITYQLLDDDKIFEVTKTLFYNDKLDLYKHFNGTNSNFGSYLSKDVEGVENARLRLNILPINVFNDQNDGPAKRIQSSFNYHLDYLTGDKVEKITSFLSKWTLFDAECLLITESIK